MLGSPGPAEVQLLSDRACRPQPSSGNVALFLLNVAMPSLVASLVRGLPLGQEWLVPSTAGDTLFS